MESNIVKITTWPFRAPCQAWKDYQKGRQMRKYQEGKLEVIQEKQTTSPETKRPREKTSQPPASHRDKPTGVQQTGPRKGIWLRQWGEYPWRLEQLTHLDHNTRCTWVLEAKDVSAIIWEKGYRMKGSTSKTKTNRPSQEAAKGDEHLEFVKRLSKAGMRNVPELGMPIQAVHIVRLRCEGQVFIVLDGWDEDNMINPEDFLLFLTSH
ncbi:hypothetical protein F4679DRAFT_588057 [Xylaria curta]|nr:hypothetical protein F4679DRAFT_588057 [Xylaria curta]